MKIISDRILEARFLSVKSPITRNGLLGNGDSFNPKSPSKKVTEFWKLVLE
jgi:hypothetical protein